MIKKKLMAGFILFCMCLVLTSCGESLNGIQKEIKESYQNQREIALKEYDDKINSAEELRKLVEKSDSLEEKKRIIVEAGLLKQEEASTYTSEGFNQLIRRHVEYQKTIKNNFIKSFDESMQKAIDAAK